MSDGASPADGANDFDELDDWGPGGPTDRDEPNAYCRACGEPLYRMDKQLWEWTGSTFAPHVCRPNTE